MSKSNNQKAILNLESNGISAKEENGTVYVCIGDSELELSQFEIDFRAKEYDVSNVKVLVRLTTSDVVLSKEEANNVQSYLKVLTKDGQYLTDVEVYHVGYELENGTECDENGNI